MFFVRQTKQTAEIVILKWFFEIFFPSFRFMCLHYKFVSLVFFCSLCVSWFFYFHWIKLKNEQLIKPQWKNEMKRSTLESEKKSHESISYTPSLINVICLSISFICSFTHTIYLCIQAIPFQKCRKSQNHSKKSLEKSLVFVSFPIYLSIFSYTTIFSIYNFQFNLNHHYSSTIHRSLFIHLFSLIIL